MIHPDGTCIRITSIDMDSLCGRDPHPEQWMEGRTANVMCLYEDEPMDGGTYTYIVKVDTGAVTVLADYEFEALV